jgi:glycosyltransferase involved in cell wall biosynthesis
MSGPAWAAARVLLLLTLGDPGQLSGGHGYQRRMAAAAGAHGFVIGFLSLPAGSLPRLSLAARGALARAGRGGAGAVLLDSIVAAGCGPWLRLAPPSLPIIGVLHQPPGGLDGSRASRLLRARLDLLAYRRARLLIVTGEPAAEALLRVGLPSGRVVVVPPGCPPARPRSAELSPARAGMRRGRHAALLCVANWHPRKGLRALLEAVARLPQAHATLHLVGDDRVDAAHTAELGRLLRSPELSERVVVHGSLPESAVAEMYGAADVFVLPSVDEPYGMAYTEALAAGLPVVGWRSGNLPRLVESGLEGVLVPPGDVAGLAAALRSLVEDGALRARLAEGARRRASTLPSWQQTAAAFFSAVERALPSPPQRPATAGVDAPLSSA